MAAGLLELGEVVVVVVVVVVIAAVFAVGAVMLVYLKTMAATMPIVTAVMSVLRKCFMGLGSGAATVIYRRFPLRGGVCGCL